MTSAERSEGAFTPIRNVDLVTLLRILGVLEKNGTLSWKQFETVTRDSNIRNKSNARQLSYSRFYHYVAAARCLGLVSVKKGRYSLTKQAKAIARNPSSQKHLSDAEQSALKRNLMNCDTMRFVAKAFLPDKCAPTLDNLERHGRVMRITRDERDTFELQDINCVTSLAFERNTSYVNTIRWGAIPILFELEVFSEFCLEQTRDTHMIFPEGAPVSLKRFECLIDRAVHELGQNSPWVPLQKVAYHLSVVDRIGPRRFERLLNELYELKGRKYELPRTLEIVLYPTRRSWVPRMIVDGSARSHIKIVGE